VPARDRRPPVDYQTDPGVPFTHSALHNDAPVGAVAAHTVARTIDQMMAQRGFTLRALAAATGMDHSTISRTLRGLTYPDVDTLAQIQTVLDVHLWPPPVDGDH
jgi:DNA-binding Xre family transcriptional regulator